MLVVRLSPSQSREHKQLSQSHLNFFGRRDKIQIPLTRKRITCGLLAVYYILRTRLSRLP